MSLHTTYCTLHTSTVISKNEATYNDQPLSFEVPDWGGWAMKLEVHNVHEGPRIRVVITIRFESRHSALGARDAPIVRSRGATRVSSSLSPPPIY